MKFIVPLSLSCKSFVWNLFHSIINYFFNIYIKGQHNLNKNCYLFISSLGLKNRILINSISHKETIYFKYLKLDKIKFEINNTRKIPILEIKQILLYPKIFTISRIFNEFEIWKNSVSQSIARIRFFDEIIKALSKYIIFKLNSLVINYKNFIIKIKFLIMTKNDRKIKLFVKKIQVYFGEQYILSAKNLKISYDLYTKKFSIFSKSILIIISKEFIKADIYRHLLDLYSELCNSNEGSLPNIYIDDIYINIHINNYLLINISQLCLENNILKCNINIKVWKKEVIWIRKLVFNINTKKIDINQLRVRLFKSTTDKLFKTLRFITKKYLSKKNRDNLNPKIKYSNPKLDNIYMNSLVKSVINEYGCTSNNTINHDYLNLFLEQNKDILLINNFIIDFEPKNGNFIFENFKYSCDKTSWNITSSKWIFFKDDIRYLDSTSINDVIKFEVSNNTMNIYPYNVYINLDIEQFSNTFSHFAKSIDRIIEIFNFSQSKPNYLFEKFYINSFRSIFSYSPGKVKFSNILSGNYTELLNMLDLTDIDIILKDITISYPSDFSFILKILMKNIIEDVIDNNFETIIKKTPVALSYKLKKELCKIPKIANKLYNTINNR